MHVRKKGKTQREEKQDGRERDSGSEIAGERGRARSEVAGGLELLLNGEQEGEGVGERAASE